MHIALSLQMVKYAFCWPFLFHHFDVKTHTVQNCIVFSGTLPSYMTNGLLMKKRFETLLACQVVQLFLSRMQKK